MMEMTTERRGGVLSLGVQGRIDGASVDHFEQAVDAAIAADDRAVVLDLGALDYLSSAGLRAILLIAKTLWERDGYFALCSMAEPVREVFEISGFDKIIAIHPSPEPARAAARASLQGA
jgi:anti-anti-sigma factor